MNKQGVGVIFIVLSAIIFITNKAILYLSAAIIASGGAMHTNKLENIISMIENPIPNQIVYFSLIIGLLYLILGEYLYWKNR